ncbi:MAG: DUF502 domain-containing protein [Hyphomicrobiales bacterium]
MTKLLGSIFRTFVAGALAILPIALTVMIVVWLGRLLHDYAGPGSLIGKGVAQIGFVLAPSDAWAYFFGIAVIPIGIYFIGLFFQTSVAQQINNAVDRFVARIPLVGSIYGLTNRFAAILDQEDDVDLKSMSPVWVTFGGERGVSVLALMSTADIVMIDGKSHHIVLVPSAPIPVGGGLVFVPTDWVRPAEFGVEALTNIYVSMGVAAPQYLETLNDDKIKPAETKKLPAKKKRARPAKKPVSKKA